MNDWTDAERQVERAHELFEAGRWDEAETLLRRALSVNPYRSEWHFNLALTLDAAGRFKEAIDSFAKAHELNADEGRPCVMAGLAAMRMQDPASAVTWFEKAEEAGSTTAESYIHRVEAYAQLGDHEKAELMFYMAVQLEPGSALAHANLAESLLARRQVDRAVWCLREAAKLDPGLPQVHARLAAAYASTGRLERARQLYLQELRRDPGDTETLLDLGELLVEMGRLTEAGEKFRRVLELEPDHPDAHFLLGDVASRQERPDEARRQYELALRLDESYPSARPRLARLMLADAEPGAAPTKAVADLLLAEVDAVLEQPTGGGKAASDAAPSVEELMDLAELLLDVSMTGQARRVLDVVLRRRSGWAPALHLLALAHLQEGALDEGIRHSRAVLRADPRFVPAMHNIAVASLRLGRPNRARFWVRQGLLVDPEDASLKRLRFRLRMRAWTGGLARLAARVGERRGGEAKPSVDA